MTTADDVCVIKFVGKHGGEATVSPCDVENVSKYRWRNWGGYANDNDIGTMHALIMDVRPAHIPLDYVIDHADRNRMNNTRSNLRWVSKSFNMWNSPPREGSSRFRGVRWEKGAKKWRAVFRRSSLGCFDNEIDAAYAAAKAAIREWPEWTPTSDLLVGPDLFSADDIAKMQAEIANEGAIVVKTRYLPPVPTPEVYLSICIN